jgi:hypothetical protein
MPKIVLPPIEEIRLIQLKGTGSNDDPYYIDAPTFRILGLDETAKYLQVTGQELPETTPPTVAVHVPL